MDIHDIHHHFNISIKKLKRMEKEGYLKIGKSAVPWYWQKVRDDIRKGKMSAKSVAMAYLFPEIVEKIMILTTANRDVIRKHFESIALPDRKLFSFIKPAHAPWKLLMGATEKHRFLTEKFIMTLKAIIPSGHVGYDYVAVRLLLGTEEAVHFDFPPSLVTRGFAAVRDESELAGWSHKESSSYGKARMIYHTPETEYDL